MTEEQIINEEINKINIKIEQIYASIINESMDRETKIKTIHDYIINNTKYDVDKATAESDIDEFINKLKGAELLAD